MIYRIHYSTPGNPDDWFEVFGDTLNEILMRVEQETRRRTLHPIIHRIWNERRDPT